MWPLLAALLPLIVIFALPAVFSWSSPIPALVIPGGETSLAPEILANLSSDLGAVAIGAIIGCAVLIRERAIASRKAFRACAILIVSAAIASCYAGFRFRFALAEQIALVPLDLNLIGDRLAAQGLLLIIAISALFALAMLVYFQPHHDRPDAGEMDFRPGAADEDL